jgi:hypothetical protein
LASIGEQWKTAGAWRSAGVNDAAQVALLRQAQRRVRSCPLSTSASCSTLSMLRAGRKRSTWGSIASAPTAQGPSWHRLGLADGLPEAGDMERYWHVGARQPWLGAAVFLRAPGPFLRANRETQLGREFDAFLENSVLATAS